MSFMRLRGLVRKEGLQILRDPSSIIIALIMPIVLILLHGYGISLDPRDVPVGVVVARPTADTAGLFTALSNSPFLKPIAFADVREAEDALRRRRVDGFIVLREDFSRNAGGLARPAPIQLVVNGVDANSARILQGYVEGAVVTWVGSTAGERRSPIAAPIALDHRYWFNAELRSANFIVPGLIAMVMTLIGALLTAMVVSREWERGTMEALMVTPASMTEIMLAKLLSYFTLGMGGMAVSVGLAIFLFGVPFRGSFAMLTVIAMTFLIAALGMGLLISTVARNQFVAAQAAFVTTYMPALMLSGFLFDIGTMPAPIQAITHIVAARYFVDALQTIFLAGNVWAVLLPNLAALAGFAVFFFVLTLWRSRGRLD
ncbi:MAG: ABC transporter permease [Alphaproteobacteria bacterium]|nr:ABC transporter permease [Alphaproteobacteria bacterium]